MDQITAEFGFSGINVDFAAIITKLILTYEPLPTQSLNSMKKIFTIRLILALPFLIVAATAIVFYEMISGIKFEVETDI